MQEWVHSALWLFPDTAACVKKEVGPSENMLIYHWDATKLLIVPLNFAVWSLLEAMCGQTIQF